MDPKPYGYPIDITPLALLSAVTRNSLVISSYREIDKVIRSVMSVYFICATNECYEYFSFCPTCTLHGSETRPLRNENESALACAQMRMVRWMCELCGVRQTDRYSSVVLKDSLGFEEGIAAVLRQSRLIWYTHVLRKDEGDWVRRCLAYAVEGIWPKKTWKEVELKCLYLRASNALDHNKWRKLIRDKRSHSDDESGDSI